MNCVKIMDKYWLNFEFWHHGIKIKLCFYMVQSTRPRFNMKMTSYQYRKSHCGDKTTLRPSYLYNGISYTGKITSLYWNRALISLKESTARADLWYYITPQFYYHIAYTIISNSWRCLLRLRVIKWIQHWKISSMEIIFSISIFPSLYDMCDWRP